MPDSDSSSELLARVPAGVGGRALLDRPPAPAAGAGRGAEPFELARRLAGALDVLVLALASVPALALGAPALGFLVGAGGWLAQRLLARYDGRWIARVREPGTRLGLGFIDAFGRIWLLAGAIVAAAVVGGRADGLTAALVIFAAYSLAFAVRLVRGVSRGASVR